MKKNVDQGAFFRLNNPIASGKSRPNLTPKQDILLGDAMAHEKYGKLHLCLECNIKFFDLGKGVPTCPKCGKQIEAKAKAKAANESGKAKAKKSQDETEEIEDLDSIDDFDGDYDEEIDGDFGEEMGGSSDIEEAEKDDDEDDNS